MKRKFGWFAFSWSSGSFLVLFAWCVTHIPFLRHYYSPCAVPDFGSYVTVAFDIMNGKLPLFTDRTPGYPLFIALIYSLFGTNYALVCAQALLVLISSLLLVFGACRFWIPGGFLSGLALGGFLFFREQITNNFSLMSESLYTSCMILVVAALLWCSRATRWGPWALLSLAMALVIYCRPAGLFVIPIWLLLILWVLCKRIGKSSLVALSAPFLLLITGLCTYNFFSAGYFGISAYGEANLAGATSYFWSDDPSYPPKLRAALKGPRERLSLEQRSALDVSWDFEVLYPLYSDTYNLNLFTFLYPYLANDFVSDFAMQAASDQQLYHARRDLKRRISLDAIYANPLAYLKFVATQLYGYYWYTYRWKYGDFYDYPLPLCYKMLFFDKSYAKNNSDEWRRNTLREYYDPSPLGGFKPAPPGSSSEPTLVPTRPLLLERYLRTYIGPVILWQWWGVLLLGLFVLNGVWLIFTRLRSEAAFFQFVLVLMVVGHSILVSLVEISLTRYVAPLDFITFVAAAISPALFFRRATSAPRSKESSSNLSETPRVP